MGDHLGLNYISTVEDLAVVKRVIVRKTSPNPAPPCSTRPDPIVAAMAGNCPGSITYFARTASIRSWPTIAPRATGSSMSDGQDIVCAQGKTNTALRWLPFPLPATAPSASRPRTPWRRRRRLGFGSAWGHHPLPAWELHQRRPDGPGRFNLFQITGPP